MFRLLTSLPPGQVRFTIIDPIGIGRNFGAFMHLADFDEALVTNQVWTDPRQIDERLADLAVHMETVTQKYLRNEYATIEEYNAVAGEVAEPYRVLVVADFPTQVRREVARPTRRDRRRRRPLRRPDPGRRRHHQAAAPGLLGSTTSGPTATASSWDATAASPGTTPTSAVIHCRSTAPPPADFATRQIQKVGAAAQGRQARRGPVRVHRAARRRPGGPRQPLRDRRPARQGRRRPSGRTSTLGQGTSQHVLIAGRTGSGKSTLDARPDHQPRPELQPRRDRALPDRLQEGGRVQGLRHPRAAPRAASWRSRASASSASASRSGSTPSCACGPTGSATPACRTSTAIATPRARPRCPASC